MNLEELNEQNDKAAELFNDLPPFTITINNGHDAAWLSSAMLLWLAGDYELAKKSMDTLIIAAATRGTEDGVNEFFDEGIRRGHKFPKCMKPLFIHMLDHAIKKIQDKE